ncbi:MAG: hypothetical protein LBD73_01265, partial [Deferribacteraceae bacterium]|nr:hypothetical protein [Deferribacteraceae bacterium]
MGRILLMAVLLAFVIIIVFFRGTDYNPVYINDALQPDKMSRDMLEDYFKKILKNEMPSYRDFKPDESAEELFELGLKDILVWDAVHFASGANLLKKAADGGSVRAMDLLGYIYDRALTGGRYDAERSLEWFLKSADFGSFAGLHYACKYYAFKKEYKSAAPYCEMSAQTGIPMSMAIMAEFYLKGLGVKKNTEAGKRLICEARNRGRKAGNL